MSSYDWPPSDSEQADEWAYEHPLDAIAYAAGWTHSGWGYGPDQARKEWPEMEGFDFMEGLPDWDTGLEEDPDYEYRTMLMAGDPYTTVADETEDGWERVASFGINPEPELFDEDGSASGHMYLGEGNREVVYRRRLWEEEEYDDETNYEENPSTFRRITDAQAERLLGHYRDVSTEGYVTAEPRSLVKAFGKPGPGDKYKSALEWWFESDDERIVSLADDRATSSYRSGLPTPKELAGSSKPTLFRVSTHDERTFVDFAAWLSGKVNVSAALTMEDWLAEA